MRRTDCVPPGTPVQVCDGFSIVIPQNRPASRPTGNIRTRSATCIFECSCENRDSMTRRMCFLAAAGLLTAACGRKKTKVSRVPPPPSQPQSAPSDYAPESGLASWYGHPYHGRASASGEIYDMEQMTAAHRTLPFGTVVHVENLENGMTTDVRINDRGPFINGRVIDLSHAAARTIKMLGPGTARVRLTIVQAPAHPEPALFAVQVGAFANRDNADRMQNRMSSRYGSAALALRSGTPPLWRVLVGRAPDTDAAERLAQQIRGEESVPQAFVVRLDAPARVVSGTQ